MPVCNNGGSPIDTYPKLPVVGNNKWDGNRKWDAPFFFLFFSFLSASELPSLETGWSGTGLCFSQR